LSELPQRGWVAANDLVRALVHFVNFIAEIIESWLLKARWRFGSVGNVVGRINEVNQRRARLVCGWVTVCRRVNHLGM